MSFLEILLTILTPFEIMNIYITKSNYSRLIMKYLL
jgi:hypothetical protein